MQVIYIFKIIGLLLIILSLTMLPPIAVSAWYQETLENVFIFSSAITLMLGVLFWFPFRNKFVEPRNKDGFLIVVCVWFIWSLVSALPFFISPITDIRLVDAIFESTSGITATGATVLLTLDNLPKSILYYRQQLQFLGGMGIIVLAIAILPALGIGGMQLFQAEITGPVKNAKLTPRIAQTAKGLWTIYVGLTVFCAIGYWAAGMDIFESICTSFSTVSTGGLTTHDQSIGYFDNQLVQIVAIIFMFLGAINFSLHYITANYATIKHYLYNIELKIFTILIFLATILCAIVLWKFKIFSNKETILLESLFHVVSITTTTGFSSSAYYNWPLFVPILLFLLAIVGGCAGSTSGGIKVVRLLLLHKQGTREINRLIHPNGYYVIKFGKAELSNKIINAIWGFLATYVAIFAIILLLLLTTGLDFLTSYAACISTLSNTGASLGQVATNFKDVNDFAKIILSLAMIIGRLEIFTVLVLFSPTYWRS